MSTVKIGLVTTAVNRVKLYFTHSTYRLLIGTMVPKEAIFLRQQKRILELTDFEWRLLVGCLNTARSAYFDEGKPIEDVNILLIKVISTKQKEVRV